LAVVAAALALGKKITSQLDITFSLISIWCEQRLGDSKEELAFFLSPRTPE